MKNLFNMFVEFATEKIRPVKNAFHSFKSFCRTTKEKITETAKAAKDTLAESFSKAKTKIIEIIITTVVLALISIVVGFFNEIKNLFTAAISKISDFFTDLFANIKDNAAKSYHSATEKAANVVGSSASILNAFVSNPAKHTPTQETKTADNKPNMFMRGMKSAAAKLGSVFSFFGGRKKAQTSPQPTVEKSVEQTAPSLN